MRKRFVLYFLLCLMLLFSGCQKKEAQVNKKITPTLHVSEKEERAEITETPIVTDAPKVTEKPVITVEPEVTEVPIITIHPEPTKVPEPSEEPSETEKSESKDSDGDGIVDEEEEKYGTSMDSEDTDGDGLTDGYEVMGVYTDPLSEDTDGDGIDDTYEVLVGLNPLKASSNGEIVDSEKKYVYNVELEAGNLSVKGNANVFSVYAEPESFGLTETVDVYGKVYEFYLENSTFETATLTLYYDKSEAEAAGFVPEELQICQVFSDGTMETVESSVNDGNGTVTATLEHFSLYALSKKWSKKEDADKKEVKRYVVANSGFDIKKNAFSFANYVVKKDGKMFDGQCRGMVMIAQLYYRGILPCAGEKVKKHWAGGKVNGDELDGLAYDLSEVEGISVTESGYVDNSIPLKDKFQLQGFAEMKANNGKWKRDIKNNKNLVLSDERKAMVEENPLYTVYEMKAPKGAVWSSGDNKEINVYEDVCFSLNSADVSEIGEEHQQLFQLLSTINHWYGTQGTEMITEIEVTSGSLFDENPHKKNFNKLIELVNAGIPLAVSSSGHTVNLIRIERSMDNPKEYFFVVYDNNYPENERIITVKEKERPLIHFNATFWNNSSTFYFYDTDGIFPDMKGKEIRPVFSYLTDAKAMELANQAKKYVNQKKDEQEENKDQKEEPKENEGQKEVTVENVREKEVINLKEDRAFALQFRYKNSRPEFVFISPSGKRYTEADVEPWRYVIEENGKEITFRFYEAEAGSWRLWCDLKDNDYLDYLEVGIKVKEREVLYLEEQRDFTLLLEYTQSRPIFVFISPSGKEYTEADVQEGVFEVKDIPSLVSFGKRIRFTFYNAEAGSWRLRCDMKDNDGLTYGEMER